MAIKTPKLMINTPTGHTKAGRGFYQLEEDALYVELAPHRDAARFFSYLESDTVRFDVDMRGRLLLVEVDFPRRRWTVEEDLSVPVDALPADIRWLDFRQPLERAELLTDPLRQYLCIRFSNEAPSASYYLAEDVIAQTDADKNLVALWVTDIVDDLGGREISNFRKYEAAMVAETV